MVKEMDGSTAKIGWSFSDLVRSSAIISLEKLVTTQSN